MHGGAKGSGAPKGNQNALKQGSFTQDALQERAVIRELSRKTKEMLKATDLVD
jgi:glucans biosynthesis protein